MNLSLYNRTRAGSFHQGVRAPRLRSLPASPCWSTAMAGRMVLLRHGATEWSLSGQHTGRTDIPLLEEGGSSGGIGGRVPPGPRPGELRSGAHAALCCGRGHLRLAGFEGELEPDLMEWDYGEYEGSPPGTSARSRPDWSLWEQGVPGGERAAEVGRRVDRVIERARNQTATPCAWPTATCCGSWRPGGSGFPPIAGRLFLLGAGAVCVLGWDLDCAGDRAVEPVATRTARGTAGSRGAVGSVSDRRRRRCPGPGRPCRPGCRTAGGCG